MKEFKKGFLVKSGNSHLHIRQADADGLEITIREKTPGDPISAITAITLTKEQAEEFFNLKYELMGSF
jgi:hypothetical protein